MCPPRPRRRPLLPHLPRLHAWPLHVVVRRRLQPATLGSLPLLPRAGNQTLRARSAVKWGADYLAACHASPFQFVGLIGDMSEWEGH